MWVYRGQRISGVLLYPTPSNYSLETQSLTEPGARIATRKPQWFSYFSPWDAEIIGVHVAT